MYRLSVTSAVTAIVILISPVASFAQSAGAPVSAGASSPPASGCGPNTGAGVTTGSAAAQGSDAAIAEENKTIDRRLNSICRGC